MNGVLSICDLPLVSADFNHNDSSSIFDLNHIYQIGNQTKILAWYDNEWGFSKFWPASTTTTEAPSSGGSNPVTTQPRPISTTTTVEAVEDDGQSEDDFADIGVSLRSGKFDMRISSSFPETEMMLRAFKKGSKSIIWNMTTNADGHYRILTNRALKGFTLSLWIDGDKWDSLTVR